MAITLQFDHPHFPDDVEFGVQGLGQIPNRGTVEIDDETAELYEATNGITIQEAFKHNPMFTVNGVKGVAMVKPDEAAEEVTATAPSVPPFAGVTPVVANDAPDTPESGDS